MGLQDCHMSKEKISNTKLYFKFLYRILDDSGSFVPDFGGNLLNKEITSKLLFSIIMGHIVLPKKNPILIEDYQQNEVVNPFVYTAIEE